MAAEKILVVTEAFELGDDEAVRDARIRVDGDNVIIQPHDSESEIASGSLLR